MVSPDFAKKLVHLNRIESMEASREPVHPEETFTSDL